MEVSHNKPYILTVNKTEERRSLDNTINLREIITRIILWEN
jgi:hypothetical protein